MFTKESVQGLMCKLSKDGKRVFLSNDADNIFYEDKR